MPHLPTHTHSTQTHSTRTHGTHSTTESLNRPPAPITPLPPFADLFSRILGTMPIQRRHRNVKRDDEAIIDERTVAGITQYMIYGNDSEPPAWAFAADTDRRLVGDWQTKSNSERAAAKVRFREHTLGFTRPRTPALLHPPAVTATFRKHPAFPSTDL